MKRMDEILAELREDMGDMPFHEILRQARDRMGLMQYRTAEFLGMRINRLKNLETGYYRQMPTCVEMDAICAFYELPKDVMVNKAALHIEERTRERKIRVISDGTSAV